MARGPASSCPGFSRRSALAALGGLAVAGWSRPSAAAASSGRMPVLFVSHGSPLLAIDPVRRGELEAWGAGLPKARGFVVMTPHVGSRRLEIGPKGPGFARFDMPRRLRRQLPEGLDYVTPENDGLAERVAGLLGAVEPVARPDRRGLDHTTWMPLRCFHPEADAPVVEVAYPYRPEADLFALGRALAPLREEGIILVGSGQWTHNLAAVTIGADVPAPAWSKEFDAWGADTLARFDVDALLDWRHKAPGAEIAHPDDGGHFRMLLFALGAAAGNGGARPEVAFPVRGFEGPLSKRGAELGR